MILHIDMDAFFAAIEQRDNPSLKGQPVIISRDHARSVVATASYEARKFGIHSAMPVFQAKQRCDHLKIIPGNMEKYKTVSQSIMNILASFSPVVEQVSIDEAYVDIQGCERLFGPPDQIGRAIKKQIFNHLNLTSSVGIAPIKFLSKIASGMNKPDGLTIIEKSRVKQFIDDLPIDKVPGVGKRVMDQMALLQIKTLGDVRPFSVSILTKKFGTLGPRLLELSNGIDASSVNSSYTRKSISSETTLAKDISDFEAVKQIILDLSQTVGHQLRKKNLVCETVSIKLKFSDFSQITRQKKLNEAVCSSSAIFNEALLLYRNIDLKKKIRLVGVGVSALKDKDNPVQMTFMTQESLHKKHWDCVDKAVDSISEKFGTHLVTKASLKPISAHVDGKTTGTD
ncbi:MAG: DNA polymerase IV [Pseudomonadota bacterium]